MAQSPTPVSAKEKQRIADALSAGVPLKNLYCSGRFKGVSEKAMRQIADEKGVVRRKCRRKGGEALQKRREREEVADAP